MKLLVVDNTQYVEFARTLGRSGLFDEVGYFAPWQEDTPTVQEASVGCGFPEIIREFDLFACLDQYDAFAFPALYWEGMQSWLRHQQIPVWGAGRSEQLETNRWLLVQTMQSLHLPTPEARLLTLDEVKRIAVPGDIIKISTFRGDTETIKHDGDWSWWYSLMHAWGPMRDKIRVVYEKPIAGKHCEPGFDLLVVKGNPVRDMGIGFEVKDGGYIEKNIRRADLETQLPDSFLTVYNGVRQMIGPDYSNFLSTEMLGEYLLDITCRIPQPPGDLKLYIWQELSRVICDALHNRKGSFELNPRHEWGVQLIAHNNNPKEYCRFGKIDPSISDHVFFNRPVLIDGVVWTVPWKDRSVQDWVDCASVCASGRTPEAAIAEAKRIVDEIDWPHGAIVDPTTEEHLMKALEDGEKEDIYL